MNAATTTFMAGARPAGRVFSKPQTRDREGASLQNSNTAFNGGTIRDRRYLRKSVQERKQGRGGAAATTYTPSCRQDKVWFRLARGRTGLSPPYSSLPRLVGCRLCVTNCLHVRSQLEGRQWTDSAALRSLQWPPGGCKVFHH